MNNVLITGGTTGIGYSLAKIFAANNYNIIIVSSNYDNLTMTQRKLENDYSVSVKFFEQDLSRLNSAEELYGKVKAEKIDVDILVNNAAFGLAGATEKIDFHADERLMVLNMISLVGLCKLFLTDMYKKHSGKILNVSSIGAFQSGSFTSTYFASKSFVLSYSNSIRKEAQKHGVQVCTLCPGATKTGFFKKEGTQIPKGAMPPEKVAEYAYRQLMKNKAVFIPGLKNKLAKYFCFL